MTEPTFTYDETSGRYRSSTGRYVSSATVRASLDVVLADADSKARALGDAIRAGKLSLEDWEIAMRAEIKLAQLQAMYSARGGRAFMTPADYGRVGQIIRTQYEYLQNFAKQIAAGLPLDGRFIARATLYEQAGRATYEAAVAAERTRQGYDEERSILHPSDHCDECVEQAALGWQPIGEMVPIGERQCLSRCRCTVEYRNVMTGDLAA